MGATPKTSSNISKKSNQFNISCIFSNKQDAYVLQRAERLNTPTLTFSKAEFNDPSFMKKELESRKIDFIVLAGFLLLVPSYLIEAFPNKIINLHPSLLPKFGGKGMYGSRVHEAVIEQAEKQSGITIHIVNKEYDKGKVLFQATTDVSPNDTPDSLAGKIHELEFQHLPSVVESHFSSLTKSGD